MTTISLPFRFDSSGRVAVCSDAVAELATYLTSVIGTHQGERVMRPTYGSNVLNYQFDFTGQHDVKEMVSNAVREAIGAALPSATNRVTVTTRRAKPDDNTLEVRIAFLTNTNEEGVVSFVVNAE